MRVRGEVEEGEEVMGGGEIGNPLMRKLLSKGGKKGRGAPPAAPPPAVVINVEEVPNFTWERQCQEEMVLKGLITVHGVHVELLPEAAAAASNGGKVPTVAQEALDLNLQRQQSNGKGKRG
jgi:hypothetical protein